MHAPLKAAPATTPCFFVSSSLRGVRSASTFSKLMTPPRVGKGSYSCASFAVPPPVSSNLSSPCTVLFQGNHSPLDLFLR